MVASFLAWARQKAKPGGRIGFVLPLTASFADSWTKTRQMIEQDFDEVMVVAVVAGQALGRKALSADTYMEEMLLIGTRKRDRGKNGSSIWCVSLYRSPAHLGEAREIARTIANVQLSTTGTSLPIRLGKKKAGLLCTLETKGNGSPWSPVGTLQPDLVQTALRLGRGILAFGSYTQPLGLSMVSLNEVFAVGPAHSRIGHPVGGDGRGAFAMYPVRDVADTIGSDRALWAANHRAQKTLVVYPTHKGAAPKGVGSEVARHAMRAHQSTLFYARNMRWTSQALLCASTMQPAMGGSTWVSLSHESPQLRKAFALWGNSTLGLLIHWTQGQRTQTGRSRTQIGAVKKMPCPRLDRLPVSALEGAAAAFDRLKGRVLLSACQAHADPVRHEIDAAVLRMIGHTAAAPTVATLCKLWCHEPSVHGGNRRALRALGLSG